MQRVTRIVLAFLSLGVASVAKAEENRMKPPVQTLYVKMPYAQTLDELVYKEAIAGKHVLPPTWKLTEGKIISQTGFEIPSTLIARRLLGCSYENISGCYFVPVATYQKYEKQLPANHNGRLEFFQKPGAVGEPGKAGEVIVFDLNPNNFELFVWDDEDKVFRYPVTLTVVPLDTKLENGKKLYDHKIAPALKRGRIGESLDRHWAKLKKLSETKK